MVTVGTAALVSAAEAGGVDGEGAGALRLRSFPVEGGRTLDLVRKECSGKSCQLVVQLAERSKVLDEGRLEWRVAPGRATREQPDVNSGVRGALSRATTPVGLSLSNAEDVVATFPRLVRLAPARTGLLVTQRGGYRPVKRRHDLFVVSERRLLRAWAAEEPPGPAWSTTEVVRLAGGRDAIVPSGRSNRRTNEARTPSRPAATCGRSRRTASGRCRARRPFRSPSSPWDGIRPSPPPAWRGMNRPHA
jgi:hypothetical protein